MPALMYHDIVADGMHDASGFPGRDAARYKITPAQFASYDQISVSRRGRRSGLSGG